MTVYLVGAGPGDPGLLTVRGAEVLSLAQVVLFDRLVSEEVLLLAPRSAVLVDVGKKPGSTDPRRQAEINDLLVEHGRSGKVVVRLKGGDPFVFGRGGEEAEALLVAGLEFEVVPGVSSAFAVPASAGVPVTHRGLSRSVTVVTGHVGCDPARAAGGVGDLDWEALARGGGTLVVMMGMIHRGEIARRLVSAGRAASTPVAVVEQGTTPWQRVARCTLATLEDVELDAPAIIVVGEVARLDLRPPARALSGLSVVVTRPRDQARSLLDSLRAAGARTILLPVIALADPPDGGEDLRRAAGLLSSGRYRWVVFTSANAVHRLFSCLRDARELTGVRVAAVGGATAAALESHGVVADLVPASSGAEELARSMPVCEVGRTSTSRVLFPRAEKARESLVPGLVEKGWEVEEVVAYSTVAAGAAEGVTSETVAEAAGADVVTFASPSAVRSFLDLLGDGPKPGIVACIGSSTAEEARASGLHVDVVAREQSADGLVAGLVSFVASREA